MVRKFSLFLSIVALSVFAVQAATLSGVVKVGDTSGAVIPKAVVTLTTTGGGGGGQTLVDTTDASGAFSFANVSVATHRIVAAKTGYLVATATTVQITSATASYTQDLFLTAIGPAVLGKITGTVYDSVAGTAATPLSGARIIISSGFGGGANRDTTTSAANGTYTFDSVALGTYTLTASATGHSSLNGTATVTNATARVVNFKLLQLAMATISGTVTDSATPATTLVGAKIYVLTRGGAAAIVDSTVTAAGGAFSLSVPSNATYTVRASAADYVTGNINVTLAGTTGQALTFKLVKILMASVSGTITDSSASGVAPLANAKVYLRTNGGTILDSAVTPAAGTYTFANVPSGVSYTVRATATGYVTGNTNVNVTGTTAVTVNIRLVKMPSANLFVLVKKSSDSTTISGADVATTGAAALDAATSTNGVAAFLGVPTGNYTLTISAANYTARSVTTALTANAVDTVKIYLVAAVGGTKVLFGTVVDSSSASKAGLQNVKVVLTIQGAGIGGGTLTLIDSTDAKGFYSFVGIPIARTTGTITATLTNYRVFTNTALTMGQVNAADTTTYRIPLLPIQSSVNAPIALSKSAIHGFSMSSAGMLRLNNLNDAGLVRVYSMNGKLLFDRKIAANTTLVAMPSNIVQSGSLCIVSVSQTNAVYRKQVFVP